MIATGISLWLWQRLKRAPAPDQVWPHQRRLLSELAQAYTSTLEIDDVLEVLCRRTSEALQIDEVAVMLADQSQVVVAAAHGVPESESIVGVQFAIGEGLTGVLWSAESGRIYLPDVANDGRYLHWKGRHRLDAASAVGIRLDFQGEPLGILACTRHRRDAFTGAEIESLEIVARHAAIAVHNAQLYERTLELAIHDDLTGLLNRRQFTERLQAEWRRRVRFGDPIAVLMIDVDHFKRFNTEYGHLVGDEVLKQVADTLKSNLRSIDECARYGGEEFVVMLSRTGPRGGMGVAEKLRKAIETAEFEGIAPEFQPTISVGLAVVRPSNTELTPIEVVGMADAALLQAKAERRNRVEVARDLDPP